MLLLVHASTLILIFQVTCNLRYELLLFTCVIIIYHTFNFLVAVVNFHVLLI
jgi:hypothetical protein